METDNGPRLSNGAVRRAAAPAGGQAECPRSRAQLVRVDPWTGGIPADNLSGKHQISWGLRQPFRHTQ
jgi:hypothetical protein